MKIFITGGTGLLGSELLRSAPLGVDLAANYHNNQLIPDVHHVKFTYLDITDKKLVNKVILTYKPDFIIHTAAKSSPDFCEKYPEEAHLINVEGTINILKAGREVGSKILVMSSNQVFSGNKPPYSEKSKSDPVNYYGKTKVKNENEVLSGKYTAIVIRLMTLYGWGNPNGQINTAMWVFNMLTQNKPIKVVDDIFNNFLWVGDAAKSIWKIVTENMDIKLIQLAGAEIASRYAFAVKVAETFKLDRSLITPVPKSFFKDEAPRPYNTIYDISLMKKIIDIKPKDLHEGLTEMKKSKNKIKWKSIKDL